MAWYQVPGALQRVVGMLALLAGLAWAHWHFVGSQSPAVRATQAAQYQDRTAQRAKSCAAADAARQKAAVSGVAPAATPVSPVATDIACRPGMSLLRAVGMAFLGLLAAGVLGFLGLFAILTLVHSRR